MKALEIIISELNMKQQSIPQFQGLHLALANLDHQQYPEIFKGSSTRHFTYWSTNDLTL